MVRATALLLSLLLAVLGGCRSVDWQADLVTALQQARSERADLVVFFALPGRDASDRMQASLRDPEVIAALAHGDFQAAVADGVQRKGLYATWVGFGEGMGIAVLDGEGRC